MSKKRMRGAKDNDDPYVPETEKYVLIMPRFFADQLSVLGYKVGHHESLCGRQINHRERAGVFQSVPEWATTVIRRVCVFDYTLSKAHDVRKAGLS
jgi:hypothetical protein